MTQHAVAPPFVPPPYPPPHPPAQAKRRGGRVLPIAALVVAIAAAAMAGITLVRESSQSDQNTAASAPTVAAPTAADVTVAKKEACDAWNAASNAMVAARKPFLDAPPNWNDPATVSGLVQAQAGIYIQVQYLRQHVPPATPTAVAHPIADYIAASIDLAAVDGQHQSAAVANAAADRTGAAAAQIRAACGIR
jgi:hypothetical protein